MISMGLMGSMGSTTTRRFQQPTRALSFHGTRICRAANLRYFYPISVGLTALEPRFSTASINCFQHSSVPQLLPEFSSSKWHVVTSVRRPARRIWQSRQAKRVRTLNLARNSLAPRRSRLPLCAPSRKPPKRRRLLQSRSPTGDEDNNEGATQF